MKRILLSGILLIMGSFLAFTQLKDWRNLDNAVSIIPDEGYCDQPYAVINNRGEWVVVMTTGEGREGQKGQHIVSVISKDRGRSWESLVDIEPASGPEASWVTPIIIPSGRIYVFYSYNADNMREVLNSKGEPIKRVDTMGKMMMKFSDDGGLTWSKDRYEVPMRNFEIDDNNIYKGKVNFFWSVAIPIIHNNAVYLPFAKVGNFGEGFMESGSGAILKSSNILSEADPEKITWETLPEGNKGLLPPEGIVADEHNIVSLSDGSLYCVYRTNMGHNVQTYSIDNGLTWTNPEWAKYTPGGKVMKQPRCFNKVYKFKNGKYALFFHNNSTRNYSSHPIGNRNPTWLCGGIEKDGQIYWSQPEIFLYDLDFENGISYPDWIEDNGEYYFTETQKTIARIHKIPSEYLDMIWNQAENKVIAAKGLALEIKGEECDPGNSFKFPELGKLYNGKGFSLEFRLKTGKIKKDQVLLDTRKIKTEGYGNSSKFAGNGILITILKSGEISVLLDDGRSPLIWKTDPGIIKPSKSHHIVINVDAEAKILTFLIDGDLWDGGKRPFGYARFNPYLYDVNGEEAVSFSPEFKGDVELFRLYTRCLYISEGIGNYRSGK